MKRDDMGMRISEIRTLATKYSKPELAKMVQMGLVPPQQAVMAGMMIDRITKSAMKPPETTVADDVLMQQPQMPGQPPQGMPPQDMPQQPPPVMAADGGMMGLPVGNIGNYAGGGIVAFADGGDIPGYAEGTLTSSRNDPAMRIDPRVQASRDKDRYTILSEELRNAQKRLNAGDPRAAGDIEALRREMRSVKPAPSVESGLTTLIPSAQAADIDKPVPTSQSGSRQKTARELLMEQQVMDEYGIGPQTLTPEQQKSSAESAARAGERTKLQEQLRNLEGGFFSQKPMTQAQSQEAARLRDQIDSISKLPPISSPAATLPPQPKVEQLPPSAQAQPTEPAVEGIERPEKIKAEQIKVPEETSFGKEYGDVQEAYKQAGVDTNMYKNMMSELEGKKAGFAKRKEQALYAALTSLGLGLAGARQGQVFQQLSNEGQKALGMYVNDMDKITENENKLDVFKNQLAMAENNFKRTGADSALTQVRARKERIDQIEAKNAELRSRAAEHQATVGASLYHSDVGREIAGTNAIARMEAARAAAGKAGALTQKQRFDIEQQLKSELEPKLREQYKNLGSQPAIDKKVNEKLNQAIAQRIAELQSQPSGYGGNPSATDLFKDWSVEGM